MDMVGEALGVIAPTAQSRGVLRLTNPHMCKSLREGGHTFGTHAFSLRRQEQFR